MQEISLYIHRFVRICKKQIFVNSNQKLSIESKFDEHYCKDVYRSIQMEYPKFFKMDKMCKCGIVAAELLLKDFIYENINSFKRAMVFQNNHASLHTDRSYQSTIQNLPSPGVFVYTLPNIVMGEISIKYQFKGENTFFVNQKFSSALFYEQTQMLFAEDLVELVILGFVDVNDESEDVFLCLVSRETSEICFSKKELDRLYYIEN